MLVRVDSRGLCALGRVTDVSSLPDAVRRRTGHVGDPERLPVRRVRADAAIQLNDVSRPLSGGWVC